jgi:NADPH:quinone reductase-like Zn-dependent oxidoreductase
MKAIVYDRYGSPEVLHVQDVPKPVPASNEVLIRVHATTVPAEEPMIRGFTFGPLFWLPVRIAFGLFRPRQRILGSEFSGVVESVGSDVARFRSGDEVFGVDIKNRGCYAEYNLCRRTRSFSRNLRISLMSRLLPSAERLLHGICFATRSLSDRGRRF